MSQGGWLKYITCTNLYTLGSLGNALNSVPSRGESVGKYRTETVFGLNTYKYTYIIKIIHETNAFINIDASIN